MRIEDYEYVLAIVKYGSFSKASENLSISSQGLGKAIRELEASLGCKLFDRSALGVVPTEICNQLIPEFENILAVNKHIGEKIAAYEKAQTKTETLLTMKSVLGARIAGVVEEYNCLYGKNIQTILCPFSEGDEARQFFEDNKNDYRICSKELITDNSYKDYDVCSLHFLPMVNSKSPLCKRESISLEDFEGYTVLSENMYRPNVRHLMALFEEKGVNVKLVEAFDKVRMGKIISKDPNSVYFAYGSECVQLYETYGDAVCALKNSYINTLTIVLQSRSGSVDPRLISLMQERLKNYENEFI